MVFPPDCTVAVTARWKSALPAETPRYCQKLPADAAG
jgi:hypothetical protein